VTIEAKNPVLIDMPMPIMTPRLMIRPVMPGDGAPIHEAKMESWDQLRLWMPWAKERGTPEDVVDQIWHSHAGIDALPPLDVSWGTHDD
jgi:hypothetical protein